MPPAMLNIYTVKVKQNEPSYKTMTSGLLGELGLKIKFSHQILNSFCLFNLPLSTRKYAAELMVDEIACTCFLVCAGKRLCTQKLTRLPGEPSIFGRGTKPNKQQQQQQQQK